MWVSKSAFDTLIYVSNAHSVFLPLPGASAMFFAKNVATKAIPHGIRGVAIANMRTFFGISVFHVAHSREIRTFCIAHTSFWHVSQLISSTRAKLDMPRDTAGGDPKKRFTPLLPRLARFDIDSTHVPTHAFDAFPDSISIRRMCRHMQSTPPVVTSPASW